MSTEPEELGIQDVRVLLEKTFPGCQTNVSTSLGSSSYHAELSFYEYDIRVILSGERGSENRKMHYRFMQRVTVPGQRKTTKRMIIEVQTTDDADIVRAIEDSKAHLLGLVFAIQKALRPPHIPRMNTVDDLFKP